MKGYYSDAIRTHVQWRNEWKYVITQQKLWSNLYHLSSTDEECLPGRCRTKEHPQVKEKRIRNNLLPFLCLLLTWKYLLRLPQLIPLLLLRLLLISYLLKQSVKTHLPMVFHFKFTKNTLPVLLLTVRRLLLLLFSNEVFYLRLTVITQILKWTVLHWNSLL